MDNSGQLSAAISARSVRENKVSLTVMRDGKDPPTFPNVESINKSPGETALTSGGIPRQRRAGGGGAWKHP